MTTNKQIELRRLIEKVGFATITVVPNYRNSEDDAYDLTFDNYDEAFKEIEELEVENTIYF